MHTLQIVTIMSSYPTIALLISITAESRYIEKGDFFSICQTADFISSRSEMFDVSIFTITLLQSHQKFVDCLQQWSKLCIPRRPSLRTGRDFLNVSPIIRLIDIIHPDSGVSWAL